MTEGLGDWLGAGLVIVDVAVKGGIVCFELVSVLCLIWARVGGFGLGGGVGSFNSWVI